MQRTFTIEKLARAQENDEGLLDIPSLDVFAQGATAQTLIKDFESDFGVKPKGVVIPVTGADGLYFKVAGLDDKRSPLLTYYPNVFVDTVRDFGQMGLQIYLLLDPTLIFTRTDGLHIIDLVGDGIPSLCLGNARSQQYLGAVLGTGLILARNALTRRTGQTSSQLAGLVINCSNIWPMSAKKGRIEMSCFCPSCREYFRQKAPALFDKFTDFPNPFNLVLMESPTGISYISDIEWDFKPSTLVKQSRQKGYTDSFSDESERTLTTYAEQLKEYVHTRHEQTIDALTHIWDEAQGPEADRPETLKRIVITEGAGIDWTSGLVLNKLDESLPQPLFDEVWFDPSSIEAAFVNVLCRSYMWRRGRYFIDSFFHVAASISDEVTRSTTAIGQFSTERVLAILEERRKKMMGMAMRGHSAFLSLPDLKGSPQPGAADGTVATVSRSQRIGFVGVAISEAFINAFMEEMKGKVADGLGGQGTKGRDSDNPASRRSRYRDDDDSDTDDE